MVPTKRDLITILTQWGLQIIGNESQEELLEAYFYMKAYQERNVKQEFRSEQSYKIA